MELQQTVEAHVAMQRPLLGLLGRLDLLLHKRQQVPDGEDGVDGTGDGGEGPLTVYAEGEDDVNVLNEVVGNEESDDDEWETDDEKDEDDLEGFDDEDDDDDETMRTTTRMRTGRIWKMTSTARTTRTSERTRFLRRVFRVVSPRDEVMLRVLF